MNRFIIGVACFLTLWLAFSGNTAFAGGETYKCYLCSDEGEFGKEQIAASEVYKDITFYFCMKECQADFQKDPEKYFKAMSDDYAFYFNKALAGYLGIQKALAKDSVADVQANAAKISANADVLAKLAPSSLDKDKLDNFVKNSAKIKSSADSMVKTEYTCSMHPQVKKDAAGKCPICGMDLVKKQLDIKTVRESFKGLSDAVIEFTKNFVSDKDKYSMFHCDMAPGSWIQDSKEPANPYFGSSMIKCGELQKWDAPAEKKDGHDGHDGHKDNKPGEHKDGGGHKHDGGMKMEPGQEAGCDCCK
ncbi:MAG: DUF3347 domain-containing protein [Planctomycetes bacterium]|nr:DUF3347 domain-containing protein [Planctomycetota bacterium]